MARATLVWLSRKGLFKEENFELKNLSNNKEPPRLGRVFQVEGAASVKVLQ